MGFLPSDDPKFLIYVAFDNPRLGGDLNTGGRTAAPLFAEIARLCLRNDDTLSPVTPLPEPAPNPVMRELAQAAEVKTNVHNEAAIVEEAGTQCCRVCSQSGGRALERGHGENLHGHIGVSIKGQGHYVNHQFRLRARQRRKTTNSSSSLSKSNF